MAFHLCRCAGVFPSHSRKRFFKWVSSFFTDTENNWRCPSYAMFCHLGVHLLFALFPVCDLDIYLPKWPFCPSSSWALMEFFGCPFPFSSPEVQKITKVSLGLATQRYPEWTLRWGETSLKYTTACHSERRDRVGIWISQTLLRTVPSYESVHCFPVLCCNS